MKYLVVPNGLKPNELIVYAWLYSKANHTKAVYDGLNEKEVRASSRTIAKYTETSHQAVSRTLDTLVKNGYIQCIHKSKVNSVPSTYKLTFDVEMRTEWLTEQRTERLTEQSVDGAGLGGNRWTEQLTEQRTEQLPISFNSVNVSMNSDIRDYKELKEYHNKLTLPKMISLTEQRKRLMADAIDELGFDNVCLALDKMSNSSFLKSQSWFKADWIYKDGHIGKALEGVYDDRNESTYKQQSSQSEYTGFNDYYDNGED
jgi:hypothetical protein